MLLLSLATLVAEAATATAPVAAAAAATAQASASWLPTPAPLPQPSVEYSMGQLLVNLVAVVGLLVLFAWGATRFLKGRLGSLPIGLKAKGIRVEDRLPIDPQRSVLVLSCGKRRFLVGMTSYAFNPIAELDPAQDFQQALEAEVTP